MSDEGDAMSTGPGDGSYQPPYNGPAIPETPRFGDPSGQGSDYGYGQPVDPQPSAPAPGSAMPTMPPPAPPSWLPGQDVLGPNPAPVRSGRNGKAAVAAGLVALVVVAAGVGGLVGANVNSSGSSPAAAVATTGATPTLGAQSQTVSAGSGTPKSYATIAAEVLPVVVSINVTGADESDTGSGVVIRSDGYILTNNHVVTAAAGGSGSITVNFNDGSSAPAKIIGTDLASDLAVVHVARTGLQVAHLGSSAGVKVGDAVLAVGSPLGLSGTVTSGIVSALNRPVDTTADQEQQQAPSDPFNLNGNGNGAGGQGGAGPSATPTTTTATVFGAIQTDAAINPGNSGGALVDASGNVIGINSAIASLGSSGDSQSGSIGVGFAIPIDLAKYIAGQLIATGKASHAQIGVGVVEATNQTTGATTVSVQNVTPGSPGGKAGLKVGDVITKIDSTVVTGQDALIATIRSLRPGDTVQLTIRRAGATSTVSVTLGASTS